MKIALLDGYVDEPSCLGVPPFISPYVRYTAGAILDSGNEYMYITIDEYRRGSPKKKALEKSDALVIIGGAIVPGKYLRGTPASIAEIAAVARDYRGTNILGGPVGRFGFSGNRRLDDLKNAFDFVCKQDVDAFVYDLLCGESPRDRLRLSSEWKRWAVLGSAVIAQHPDFPFPLIIELESYRGCVRYKGGGCSFCIEPLFGEPQTRDPKSIVGEVRGLARVGAVNFRLGAQSCIVSYGSREIGDSETPRPNPGAVEELFVGIRKAAPALRVLHTDNANPAVIAAHPAESEAVLKSLVKYCTSANVLALGMESADPAVIEANNLNATPAQVLDAVRLINKLGGKRGENGMPRLLPGINILCGLFGETKRTFELNFTFLKEILDSNLLLRRINIRQVAGVRTRFEPKVAHSEFLRFKGRVRGEIDHRMLKLLVPQKTILREVFVEEREGNISFGRQVGTYPLLVGIPYPVNIGRVLDVRVTDFGQRSITAVEHPLDVNLAPMAALSSLPGIGKKRAAQIVRARPFTTPKELVASLDDETVARELLDFVTL